MEIDNPRSGEVLGRFVGTTATTAKQGQSDRNEFGLTFLGRDLHKIEDPKRSAN